ncbi:MAG: hypothetical protein CL813_03915 [Confluentimicrobium sp.]|nr:hypothetical protein [Actibacterium sp.]MBF52089.1 hypothetical protein [Actibacterium sp.]
MAQNPATPKLRRLALRIAARFGLATHLPHQRSEAAALALRAAPSAPLGDGAEVVFLIPLVGRAHVGDWAQVSAALARTLQGFRNQTDPRWRAVICGQDRPDGVDFDERVQFLPFTDRVEGNDKWDKLDRLARHLPTLGLRTGYAMPFDADDLLRDDAVARMVSGAAPGGWLVTQGWVWDVGRDRIGAARPQSLAEPGQKALWKLCGSTAAFRIGATGAGVSEAEAAFLAAVTGHEHRMFPYLATLAGRPLRPLPGAPAVGYLIGHGENFGARRGRVSFKRRFVDRFPAGDAGRNDLTRHFP